MSSANRRERFLSIFPQIVEELTAYLKKEGMPKDAVEWYERVGFAQAGVLTALISFFRYSTTTHREVRTSSEGIR